MKNELLQLGSRRLVCQRVGLRERVDCATLPFTATSSAEGEKKVWRKKILLNPSSFLEMFPHTILYSQEPQRGAVFSDVPWNLPKGVGLCLQVHWRAWTEDSPRV